MPPMPKSAPSRPQGLIVRLAQTRADLRAAQRLRYRVFVEEMGGSGPMVDHDARLECDALDPLFDHLLLIDTARDPESGDHVVGAYRLLPDTRLAQAGQFYCDTEFDLAPLRQSGRRLLELGRSCIDKPYRGGVGMLQMWQGLAEYVVQNRIEILFGAASFHGADPARWAQPLSWLHHHHLAPETLRVRASHSTGFVPLAADKLDRTTALLHMPSLIRGYLRLGGVVGEGVFVDHAFQTTDVCIILDTATMSEHARALARPARGEAQ
jgi:L-ornithine Nalpha-acyltransferase